jgi:hypothetical protein
LRTTGQVPDLKKLKKSPGKRTLPIVAASFTLRVYRRSFPTT